MQSREDTQMQRLTNGTCLETTCLQTKWKGEEGRFKRKKTILVSKNSNLMPNLLENKFGERCFHLTSPLWNLPWQWGLRDLSPVNSVDFRREFYFIFSGKQENKKTNSCGHFSKEWWKTEQLLTSLRMFTLPLFPRELQWDSTAHCYTGITSCLRYPQMKRFGKSSVFSNTWEH